MPRGHSSRSKRVITPQPSVDITAVKIKFEERDGEYILTSNYTTLLAKTRPHVVTLLGRKGIASCTGRAESLEQTLLADWDYISDIQSSDFARLKLAVDREASLIGGLVEERENALAESKTSVGNGGDNLLQEYSWYSRAIAAQTFVLLGSIVGSLERGAEQKFAKLLRDFDSKIMQDIADDSTEQHDSDMLAFKRLRAQQLATKKLGLDRSALGSVVLAMQPLCDLAARWESCGGHQWTQEEGAHGRLSASFQNGLNFYERQAAEARTISEQANKAAQDALKNMKARYKEESTREELRRIRSASLKELCRELSRYCSSDPDPQEWRETDSKALKVEPLIPETQEGQKTEQVTEHGQAEAESTVGPTNAPKSKKKKKAWYGHKQAQTAESSFSRPAVRTGWQPTQPDDDTNNAPWQKVESASGSKSSGSPGRLIGETPGPYAQYGWTFNDMFHRNIVIGKDSKIHKRAMKPDPDFGSHPLLSRAAASFFLTTNSETASELALSPDQTQAREEWRERADQRNADWANIWDQSVLTKGQSGGSETVDREVPQQGIEDSDAESEANDGEHADLPEGGDRDPPDCVFGRPGTEGQDHRRRS